MFGLDLILVGVVMTVAGVAHISHAAFVKRTSAQLTEIREALHRIEAQRAQPGQGETMLVPPAA